MTVEQKNELILRLLDSDLNEQEFDLFQNLIKSDDEFLQLYREHVTLEHGLLSSHVSIIPTLVSSKDERVKSKRNIRIAVFGIAACLMLSLCVQFFIKPDGPVYHSAKIEFAGNSKYEIEGERKSDELGIGKTLRITQGAVRLELANDVTAVVLAPAVLKIQDETTVVLEQGKASFHVPEQGVGFTVISAKGKIVDLGTQFTVISGWSAMDEIYVEKGRVEVTNRSNGIQQLEGGEAISIDHEGSMKSIEYKELQAQVFFPKMVEIVFEADFEDLQLADNEWNESGLAGWERCGQNDVEMGIYNPSGHLDSTGAHIWYDRVELNDNSDTFGNFQGMKGKCLAYIYGFIMEPTGYLKKVVNIDENTLYTFSITLGHRIENASSQLADYELAFVSGDKVIHSIKGNSETNVSNSFTSLSFTWDSSNLPEGVNVNDPLSVRILTLGADNYTGKSYLDFDDVRVTKMQLFKEKGENSETK